MNTRNRVRAVYLTTYRVFVKDGEGRRTLSAEFGSHENALRVMRNVNAACKRRTCCDCIGRAKCAQLKTHYTRTRRRVATKK